MDLPIFLDNPLWKHNIEKQEANKLYKILSGKDDCLHHFVLNINTDKFKANGIIFIPKKFLSVGITPKNNIKVYINNMLVEQELQILPNFLKFLFGIIEFDSIYEEEVVINNITKYILDSLKTLRTNEIELYSSFSTNLKETIVYSKNTCSELIDLLVFQTNMGTNISLNEYCSSIQKDQQNIFYLSGERIEELYNSPFLERINDNEIIVLLLTDTMDEYLVKKIKQYRGLNFIDITNENIEIIIDDEQSVQDFIEVEQFYKNILVDIQKLLENGVDDVRISRRLTNSPCILLTQNGGLSPNMERITRTKYSFEECSKNLKKRILEINPNHILAHALYELHTDSTLSFENLAKLLYQNTLIRCGIPIYRPIEFTNSIFSLMAFCLDIKEEFANDSEELDLQLPSAPSKDDSSGSSAGSNADSSVDGSSPVSTENSEVGGGVGGVSSS